MMNQLRTDVTAGDAAPIVYVVDDEPSVCLSLKRLLKSVGLQAQTFTSAQDFLASALVDSPGCLILDVRLPGLSGLDLQEALAAKKIDLPIVFVTGYGDIPMSVRAMRAGAVEFLTKPYREQDLLEAIQRGIQRSRLLRQKSGDVRELQKRHASLTPREQEVLVRVTRGLLNKQVAAELGTAEKTIKVHRKRVMEKMKADSLASLIRMADKLGL
jgi:FixJ family two-component response regulator